MKFNKFYNFLLILSPWVLLAGIFQYHFQSFLPYQGVFKGEYAFDFFTVIDLFVSFVLAIFLIGVFTKKIKIIRRRLPKELTICILLLLIGLVVQLVWQSEYLPILNDPFEYFRSLFIYPLVFVIMLYQTVDEKTLSRIVFSYLAMVGVFCLLALVQYFTGIFPGEGKDFMGRLVWPYIDYITLKTSSANWVAFFVTPAFLISFIFGVQRALSKKIDRKFCFYLAISILGAAVLYLVQSYGAYGAVGLAMVIYLFGALKFRHFLVAFAGLILVGAGAFLVQKNSLKYQVITNQFDNYRYENSIGTREQIWKMNFQIIKEHPVLGVGLNQYQSYFKENQAEVLGGELNESHTPPHPHNFLMGFWANLGILGLMAIFVLMVGIFWRVGLSVKNPAIFALIAMMVHGLIDSYYWKQETAYIFWLVVVFTYLFETYNNLTYHKKDPT